MKAIHFSKRRAVVLGVAAIVVLTIGLFYRYVTTEKFTTGPSATRQPES